MKPKNKKDQGRGTSKTEELPAGRSRQKPCYGL